MTTSIQNLSVTVHATTAQFPGFTVWSAMEHIAQGVVEPHWGLLSSEHVQICPQTPGHLSEEVCEKLRTLYPHVQFRLHANARVLPRHVIWDASSVSEETLPYFETLFLRQKYFGASWMSIHAGYRNQCSEEELWNNVDILRNLAEKHDTSVCIEGLYPSLKTPQWIDSWEGYEEFLVRSVPFALDLSHLNIVARKQGWRHTLVEDLVSSPLCKEIHVSGNDGHRDNHQKLTEAPSWDVHLKKAHADTVVFSEGRIL